MAPSSLAANNDLDDCVSCNLALEVVVVIVDNDAAVELVGLAVIVVEAGGLVVVVDVLGFGLLVVRRHSRMRMCLISGAKSKGRSRCQPAIIS